MWHVSNSSGCKPRRTGYIVAGYSESTDGDVTSNHGVWDYWVVKLNDTAAIEWQKSLGGGNLDRAFSIQQTTDGGYVVVGEAKSTDGDETGNHGDYDLWIVKLNNIGTIDWQKSVGGSNVDGAYSIQQTTDGGYIISGYSMSFDGDATNTQGVRDFWIVKLFSSGAIDWQKSLGSSNSDEAYSIKQTVDGGYIVAGYSGGNNGDVTNYHGNKDFWVVKFNSMSNGIDDPSIENQIKIYPNPASSELTIISSQQSINTIAVFDLLGKQVQSFKFKVPNSATQLDIHPLTPGVYFIKLHLHGGNLEVRRFVKK